MSKRSLVLAALAAGLIGAAPVFAASLVSVGVLDPTNPYSDVKAISRDGTYAVGGSKDANNITQPYVWRLGLGMQQLPNPSGASSDARGVDVRPDAQEIAISGRIGSILRYYKAPLSNLTGGTWQTSVAFGSKADIGAYNTTRVRRVTDERWFVAGRRTDAGRGIRVRIDPYNDFDVPGTGTTEFQSVSSEGILIGTDRGNAGSQRRAIWDVPPNAPSAIPGGNALRSEGYGISENAAWMSGLDYTDLGNTIYQAFRWNTGDTGMTLLGWLAGDSRSVAYAINNDGVAVGMSWNATDGERAAIWDVSGQAHSLKDLLAAAGVDTSAWTKLTRATTISDDGLIIGGYGTWAADGSTRGFLAVIPEPATLAVLALGALAALRRKRG